MVAIYSTLAFVAILSGSIVVYILVKQLILWLRKRNITKTGLFKIEAGDKNMNKAEESLVAYFFRNGISILNRPCSYLLKKFSVLSKIVTNAELILSGAGLTCSKLSLTTSVIALVFLLGLIVSLLFKSLIAGIAVDVLILVCLVAAVNAATEKKVKLFRNSIPDALRSMSTCFSTGYTLQQTFEHLSAECKGSIKHLFKKCCNVLQTGGSVHDSLEIMKKSTSAEELNFIAVALDVQHQTGGSMKPVIDSARSMVENKLELERMLEVQTAQAKLSARIVTILPFALIAVFSLISPDFLAPFFSSLLGIFILCVAFLMQAAGIILVRKMLKVEV